MVGIARHSPQIVFCRLPAETLQFVGIRHPDNREYGEVVDIGDKIDPIDILLAVMILWPYQRC